MNTLRQLRNFWIPWVTTIVLACFSNAVAQTSYKITDLGLNHGNDNFSMAMGLNNQGWTENMDGFVNPPINRPHDRCKWPRGNKHRRTQHRPRHAWRKEQLDQLWRDQRSRGSRRYGRNICSRSGR